MKRIGLRLFSGQDKFQTPFSTNTELVIETESNVSGQTPTGDQV